MVFHINSLFRNIWWYIVYILFVFRFIFMVVQWFFERWHFNDTYFPIIYPHQVTIETDYTGEEVLRAAQESGRGRAKEWTERRWRRPMSLDVVRSGGRLVRLFISFRSSCWPRGRTPKAGKHGKLPVVKLGFHLRRCLRLCLPQSKLTRLIQKMGGHHNIPHNLLQEEVN